jgi:hypothetical protein
VAAALPFADLRSRVLARVDAGAVAGGRLLSDWSETADFVTGLLAELG